MTTNEIYVVSIDGILQAKSDGDPVGGDAEFTNLTDAMQRAEQLGPHAKVMRLAGETIEPVLPEMFGDRVTRLSRKWEEVPRP